jgi:hypothetical protein
VTLDSQRVWTLVSGESLATCDAVVVDAGFEARYFVDETLVRSQVFASRAKLERHAADARESFESLGWRRAEPSTAE